MCMWMKSSGSPIFTFRFVVENTVERKILNMQEKKLQLADDVLSGAKRSTQNKLTLEDMKTLFEVQEPSKAAPEHHWLYTLDQFTDEYTYLVIIFFYTYKIHCL